MIISNTSAQTEITQLQITVGIQQHCGWCAALHTVHRDSSSGDIDVLVMAHIVQRTVATLATCTVAPLTAAVSAAAAVHYCRSCTALMALKLLQLQRDSSRST
eukprot:3941-Heterococcus_DN1.PRE.2